MPPWLSGPSLLYAEFLQHGSATSTMSSGVVCCFWKTNIFRAFYICHYIIATISRKFDSNLCCSLTRVVHTSKQNVAFFQTNSRWKPISFQTLRATGLGNKIWSRSLVLYYISDILLVCGDLSMCREGISSKRALPCCTISPYNFSLGMGFSNSIRLSIEKCNVLEM